MLQGSPSGLPSAALAGRGVGADVLTRLARAGFVAFRQERVERDPFEASPFVAMPSDVGRRLTLEQAGALERLTRLASTRTFRVGLIHGVTGSGKTEIYLRLAAEVRKSERTVLMLVPEIALTPAVSALFQQTFGREVAVQHSGLSDGERASEWERARNSPGVPEKRSSP